METKKLYKMAQIAEEEAKKIADHKVVGKISNKTLKEYIEMNESSAEKMKSDLVIIRKEFLNGKLDNEIYRRTWIKPMIDYIKKSGTGIINFETNDKTAEELFGSDYRAVKKIKNDYSSNHLYNVEIESCGYYAIIYENGYNEYFFDKEVPQSFAEFEKSFNRRINILELDDDASKKLLSGAPPFGKKGNKQLKESFLTLIEAATEEEKKKQEKYRKKSDVYKERQVNIENKATTQIVPKDVHNSKNAYQNDIALSVGRIVKSMVNGKNGEYNREAILLKQNVVSEFKKKHLSEINEESLKFTKDDARYKFGIDFINKIFGDKERKTALELVRACNASLSKGSEGSEGYLINAGEHSWNHTQRISEGGNHRTISLMYIGTPIEAAVNKAKTDGSDIASKIEDISNAGHFRNSIGFVRYSIVSDRWIHIDAIQTDFFNKVTGSIRGASVSKEDQKLVSFIVGKQDTVFKTLISKMKADNPKVSIYTMNNAEMVKKVEHMQSDEKVGSLYTSYPTKLGFVNKPVSYLTSSLNTRKRNDTKGSPSEFQFDQNEKTFLHDIGANKEQEVIPMAWLDKLHILLKSDEFWKGELQGGHHVGYKKESQKDAVEIIGHKIAEEMDSTFRDSGEELFRYSLTFVHQIFNTIKSTVENRINMLAREGQDWNGDPEFRKKYDGRIISFIGSFREMIIWKVEQKFNELNREIEKSNKGAGNTSIWWANKSMLHEGFQLKVTDLL